MTVHAIHIGAEPIAQHGQLPPEGASYGTPPTFDEESFRARFGFGPQEYVNKAVTGLLRPDLTEINHLLEMGTYSQTDAEFAARGPLGCQKAALDWFAGKTTFDEFCSSWGPLALALRGSIVVDEIRDLGA